MGITRCVAVAQFGATARFRRFGRGDVGFWQKIGQVQRERVDFLSEHWRRRRILSYQRRATPRRHFGGAVGEARSRRQFSETLRRRRVSAASAAATRTSRRKFDTSRGKAWTSRPKSFGDGAFWSLGGGRRRNRASEAPSERRKRGRKPRATSPEDEASAEGGRLCGKR